MSPRSPNRIQLKLSKIAFLSLTATAALLGCASATTATNHIITSSSALRTGGSAANNDASYRRFPAGHFGSTPLDEYVYRDDGAFSVTDLNITHNGPNYKIHFYNFTSQKWLTPADSDRHVWFHVLAVVVPDNVNRNLDTSVLYITGGSNRDGGLPKSNDPNLVIASTLALGANSTAAVLFQVPNQGITFPSDPWKKKARSEDSAIAFTWWRYAMKPEEPEWVLELPMTKAGVKALDALQQIIPQYIGGQAINTFTVAGASKRGWTTWLVGAAEANRGDKNRILAIIPLVLDALYMNHFMHRHYRSMGGWSFALRDYVDANITLLLDSPNLNQMFTFIDPYFLRDRLTMPKYIVNAGGDEFLLPDNHRHWGHDLVGETKFLLVSNAEHSMITGLPDLFPALISFVVSVQAKAVRPTVEWSIEEATGAISVTTSEPPASIRITFTDSPLGVSAGRRDFRWGAIGVDPCVPIFGGCLRPVLWGNTQEHLNTTSPTSFTALLPMAEGRFRIFTLEMRFKNPQAKEELLFTAPASVIPNVYPFPDCHGDCGTNLV